MVEYLYDAIRATAGTNIILSAKVTDDLGNPITEDVSLVIHTSDTHMIMVEGLYTDEYFIFEIPAEITKDLKGKYWYCVKHNDEQLCFNNPIYFV